MRLALIGDIHGNHLALQAVLNAAIAQSVDLLLVTGDLVGYYFAPLKVLEQLAAWEKFVVRGNHEDMLAASRVDTKFSHEVEKRYGCGVRLAIEQLSDKQLDDLCSLPHPLELSLGGLRILLCHGSPWDVDQYIYPDAGSDLMIRFDSYDFDVVVMGHTHYPMIREMGKTLLVNPGSVGQPRNRQPGASWALLDTESRSVTLHCENYDCSALVNECQRRHPAIPYLSEVLQRT
ncbi:MAG: metallophosphoesterase family protein [Pseudohongiella sp.]|nr:metallophosphoesterase family protein [Pseudohongiella sp.]